MIWFTSDLHFGHAAVIHYCKRPYGSLEEMHAALIRNWNQFVRPEDVVYIDYQREPWNKKINYVKILEVGYHHYLIKFKLLITEDEIKRMDILYTRHEERTLLNNMSFFQRIKYYYNKWRAA